MLLLVKENEEIVILQNFLNSAFSFFFSCFFFLFSMKGRSERRMNWSQSQAELIGKDSFYFLFLFPTNLLLSVYGIQISSNDCQSWMSSHSHYFCFLLPEEILRLSHLFLQCADRIMRWKVTSSLLLLSGPFCLATWGFTVINCVTWKWWLLSNGLFISTLW